MRILPALLALLLGACGGAANAPLVASDVEITRPMPGMQMAAGFLVLSNNTAAPIAITRVSSPQFEAVEIHETTITDGIARMRRLDELVVPARSSVTLERGGKHLMLLRPVDTGNTVTLQLYSGDALQLTYTYIYPTETS